MRSRTYIRLHSSLIKGIAWCGRINTCESMTFCTIMKPDLFSPQCQQKETIRWRRTPTDGYPTFPSFGRGSSTMIRKSLFT